MTIMFNISKKSQINACCYALFGLFFILLLTQYGYGVYFLNKIGYPYVEIGLTIGLSALISSILQPIIGRLVDTYRISWHRILLVVNILIALCSILMFLIPTAYIGLVFGLIIVETGCMYPFINYSPFYYEKNGFESNFGIARGFGSLTFTVFSLIIGFIISGNMMIIPMFSLVCSILIGIITILLPDYGIQSEKKERKKITHIISKYPMFVLIVLSMIFFMTFQNMFECYMINILENVGGNISNLGISNSIAAILELPVLFLFVKILNRVSAQKLVIVASLFYILRAIMMLLAQNTYEIYLAQTLQILTYAIIIPATVHLTADSIDDNDQYEAQALLSATTTIGLIFASIIGGNILQLYDINLLMICLVVLTVIGCAFGCSTLLFKKK